MNGDLAAGPDCCAVRILDGDRETPILTLLDTHEHRRIFQHAPLKGEIVGIPDDTIKIVGELIRRDIGYGLALVVFVELRLDLIDQLSDDVRRYQNLTPFAAPVIDDEHLAFPIDIEHCVSSIVLGCAVILGGTLLLDEIIDPAFAIIATVAAFVESTKKHLFKDHVAFDQLDPSAIDTLVRCIVAENSVTSILTLVTAEIRGGYNYAEALADDAADDEDFSIDPAVEAEQRGEM